MEGTLLVADWQPTFHQVFNVVSHPPIGYWAISLAGVPLFLLGRYFWRHASGSSIWDVLGEWLLGGILMFIGSGAIFGLFVAPLASYIFLSVQLTRGDFRSLEGRVTTLVAGGPGGHPAESWTLSAKDSMYHYSYSPAYVTAGFNRTVDQGGPLREGLWVRVADVNGSIARLEVAVDSSSPH